jgi:hypothetical protein
VYFTVGFASAMILIGAFDWSDRQVSSQLVVGGVSLMTLILSGYVFAATFDDKWSNHGPSDFPSPHDYPDGDGVGA